ncbi:MAG: efflux RND transporter periplasmic adaptor subunit [Pirellulaceae bacterium]
MSTQVNLQELAVDRSPRTMANVKRPRNLLIRYVVPATLLVGVAALLGWSLRDRLLPATPVTVVPVIATRSESQAADTPLFQAAGWVEPRPTPITVSALTEGIVARLTVIEGQSVEAGQPVAYLIDQDAKLAIRQADADLALRQAQLGAAEATAEAAQKLLADPIGRLAELADADAQLSKVETDLARLPAQIEAGKSRKALAEKELETKTAAKDSVPAITVQRAQSDLRIAVAQLDEFSRQTEALKREQTALTKRRDVLQRQLELKVDEQRAAAEAVANIAGAKAQVAQAEAALDIAKLRLERAVIRAPMDGKILALTSRPGAKVMGLTPAGMADASTVVTMYDPQSLQVRADVRLEDLPQVIVGQTVQIETPAVKTPIAGKVITATSIADIQKNTLQIKVAIDKPPSVIKPDMLVQVTFLAPPEAAKPKGEGGAALRIAAPSALIEGAGEESSFWVADLAKGTARRQKVKLGRPISRELIEVLSGLSIGDRLIVDGRETLQDGERIRIVREDISLGKDDAPHGAAAPGNETSTVPRHGGK